MMVLIHAKDQTFAMGQALGGKVWTQTTPVHDVRFTYNFLMRATQLTQGQFMSVNNRTNTSKHLVPGDLNLPVERVSWNDAIAYCNDLSKQEGLTPAYSEFRQGFRKNLWCKMGTSNAKLSSVGILRRKLTKTASGFILNMAVLMRPVLSSAIYWRNSILMVV
jgi:hypothetical protein